VKKTIYLLTDEKYEGAVNFPVIKIKFFSPSFSFENIDFLLFTSKNGVRGVDRLTNKWKEYPSFAIGEATAKEIEKRGGRVEFIAKSAYGDEFAKEINKYYKSKTFLFFRAKKIISPIKKIIEPQNKLKEVIIYETICNNPSFNLQKPSIVIFSSPSTVKCFARIETFENIDIIAIGKKTLKELKNYVNEEKIFLPKKPSIKECIKLAQTLD